MNKAYLAIISVLVTAITAFVPVSASAANHGAQQVLMKHANPLPNFMKVIQRYGHELNLSAVQQSALADWRRNNHSIVHSLVNDIMLAEKKLHDAALSQTSQPELQDLMDKVLSLRLQVSQRKIACRENMQKVLNSKQWSRVVELYQQRVLASN